MNYQEHREFCELVAKRQIVFYYFGYFSQNIVQAMAEAVRVRLEQSETATSTRRRLFHPSSMARNIVRLCAPYPGRTTGTARGSRASPATSNGITCNARMVQNTMSKRCAAASRNCVRCRSTRSSVHIARPCAMSGPKAARRRPGILTARAPANPELSSCLMATSHHVLPESTIHASDTKPDLFCATGLPEVNFRYSANRSLGASRIETPPLSTAMSLPAARVPSHYVGNVTVDVASPTSTVPARRCCSTCSVR